MAENRENEQKPKKERATRKQITFDLIEKILSETNVKLKSKIS